MAGRRRALSDISGRLGEEIVKRLFGLEEGEYWEIKSMARGNYRTVVNLCQLQSADKELTYCIVVYNRGERIRSKRGKRKWEFTIEEAYKRPVEFYFIGCRTLAKLISNKQCLVRWIACSQTGVGRFKSYVPVRLIRERLAQSESVEGCSVWGDPPGEDPF